MSDADVGEDRILAKGIDAKEQDPRAAREGPPLTDDQKDESIAREKRWSVSESHRGDFDTRRFDEPKA